MNDIRSAVTVEPIPPVHPVPRVPRSKNSSSLHKFTENNSNHPGYINTTSQSKGDIPSSHHKIVSNNSSDSSRSPPPPPFAGEYTSKNHQYLYSSQLDTSPIIHTLHSEWVDSPNSSVNNSPIEGSPINHIHNRTSPYSKMPSATATTTATVSHDKYETPIKSKPAPYITPVTDNRINAIKLDEKSISRSASASPLTDKHSSGKLSSKSSSVEKLMKDVSTPSASSSVKAMDIFWTMLNNITGKDKMAKVGQYLLRLLIYHADQAKTYLSDESININVIDSRYNDKSRQLDLLRNFIKHPFDFARIVVLLVCAKFSDRFAGMVSGISTYRQYLRFGKTPFRVRDLYNKIDKSVSTSINNKRLDVSLLNRKTLGEVIGLYYGFNDECSLLFKLGLLRNASFKKFVTRHEALAWYYDSILGIYNALDNINKLSHEEMELKIQIQVKHKARTLSKQILNLKANSDNTSLINYLNENSTSNKSDITNLKDIQFKKFNAYLDLYKWLSDFIFDSYTVFRMKLPFNTLQIWFGLIASSLSTFKIYRDTKKSLIEKSKKT